MLYLCFFPVNSMWTKLLFKLISLSSLNTVKIEKTLIFQWGWFLVSYNEQWLKNWNVYVSIATGNVVACIQPSLIPSQPIEFQQECSRERMSGGCQWTAIVAL